MTAMGRRWVAGSFRSLIELNPTKNGRHFSFFLGSLRRGAHRRWVAGGSPVSEKYMETYFNSNVTGGSAALESYMENRL